MVDDSAATNENTFVLDTNFILEYLKGVPAPVRFLDAKNDPVLWISDITRMELFSYPFLDDLEENRILDFLEHVDIYPVTERIGDIAIVFRRSSRRKLPDSIIVATAVHLGAPLVTSDKELLSSVFAGLSVVLP